MNCFLIRKTASDHVTQNRPMSPRVAPIALETAVPAARELMKGVRGDTPLLCLAAWPEVAHLGLSRMQRGVFCNEKPSGAAVRTESARCSGGGARGTGRHVVGQVS